MALALAIEKLRQDGILKESPLVNGVAAVSMGVVDGVPLLDLDYKEDVNAEVDMNLVMTDENQFIEVQERVKRHFRPKCIAAITCLRYVWYSGACDDSADSHCPGRFLIILKAL